MQVVHVATRRRKSRTRLAHACSWPWRVTPPPRRERASARRPQDGTVLCPAACKRRPAADQTVRHWRRLAKQGLWCHGWRRRPCGGDLARLCVRSTGVRSPGSYTPFGRRPRAPARAACATPAAAGPGWRCGGRACQLAGLRQGGAAACRVLRAPHTGGPAGALRPTLCCTRAESYNTPAAAGVCVRVRGHARLVAVRRRLRPLAGGPGRPPGAQRLARALGARSRRARAGSAQSYNMPGWRVAVGGQEGTRG